MVSRTVEASPDPAQLYAACCELGTMRDTLLVESAGKASGAGTRSLLLTRAALRITCRGHDVEVAALTPNGQHALPGVAAELSGVAALSRTGDSLHVRFTSPKGGSERQRLMAPSVLDVLRSVVLNLRVVSGDPNLPPLCAGSLSYDLLGVFEPLPEPRSTPLSWPDYEMWLAEELVWVEPVERRCTAVRYLFVGRDRPEKALREAEVAVDTMVERIARLASATAVAPRPQPASPHVDCDLDDEAFAGLVVTLKEHIVRGDVFQIVPSRTFSLPCTLALALELVEPRLIVLSPGPGTPEDAGCCVQLVRAAAGLVPLLGVCLGHQAIVRAFGGEVGYAGEVVHGKTAPVEHDGTGMFAGLPSPFFAARYHSLAATRIPEQLRVTARTGELVMAVEHTRVPIAGMQFHPESILTPHGGELISAALRWAAEWHCRKPE